ncbi:exosomal polycystin-1-interacting protein-like [Salminus brasiliensis]|uniref:exosomal polycystin-1-interacting protein-like n=1 Tax=Salminus brasiliensis TaxID=930266 RepID=UPI003B838298
MKMPSSCLPPLLCVLLPLHFAGTEAHPYLRPNVTLVFDSTIHSDSLRNCSCAAVVRPCDETLANLLCNCVTVSRSSLTPGGLRQDNRRTDRTLTVWVREAWVLRELLNGSHVPDLHLSLCAPVLDLGPAQYLTLVGLRRLQVYTTAKEALHRDQALNIVSSAGFEVQDSGLSITLLDLGSLSGGLRLKAYSVVGPSLQVLRQHFLNLTLSLGNMLSSDPELIHMPSMLTFVY